MEPLTGSHGTQRNDIQYNDIQDNDTEQMFIILSLFKDWVKLTRVFVPCKSL
jgi:hypothetical protein